MSHVKATYQGNSLFMGAQEERIEKMKNERMSMVLILAAAIVVFAGLAWLVASPVAPTTQTVEQTIPDDHIPR